VAVVFPELEPLRRNASSPLFGGSDRLALLCASAHILVIDDEALNLRLITNILNHAGYKNVSTLDDARQIESRFEQGSPPDLVMLDLHMPWRNGFALLEYLQPWINDEHLPVLVVTGDASVEARRRALALGARDFVMKPFDVIELTLRVRNQLETRVLYYDVRKQNRALMEVAHGQTQELDDARMEMLERLAVAAEYRDEETSRHTIRVGEMSGRLARELGLGEEEIRLITRAAALHDVGKIGIPDALLTKPSALTDKEMAVMRTHTTIGARILGGSQAPLLQMAEVIALSHHERWDGAGYPQQLAGDAIPLAGRIVGVADTVDAMTNDRPYRQAATMLEAIAEVRLCSGGQFDPAVVQAFVRIME
jgi:putative two-component system response regulator